MSLIGHKPTRRSTCPPMLHLIAAWRYPTDQAQALTPYRQRVIHSLLWTAWAKAATGRTQGRYPKPWAGYPNMRHAPLHLATASDMRGSFPPA